MRTDPLIHLIGHHFASLAVLLLAAIVLPIQSALAADGAKFDYLSLNRSVAYLDEEITVSYILEVPKRLRDKPVHLHFYLDDRDIGGQDVSGFDETGRLASEFRFKARPQGRYQLRAVLTSDQAPAIQAEEHRKLAILSLPGGVTDDQTETSADTETTTAPADGETLPDISPISLEIDNPSPRSGEEIVISTRVANIGTAGVNNVKLRVFIDGLPLGRDTSVNLAAGQETDIETRYKPSREGQQDILVMINPDSEIQELSGRNNIISRPIIVRPGATKPAVPKPVKTTAKGGKKGTPRTKDEVGPPKNKQGIAATDQPNLVTYVETIDGIHYATDNRLHVFVSNNSRRTKSGPFVLGVRRYSSGKQSSWLARKTVASLDPGEIARIAIDLPANSTDVNRIYTAVADADNKVAEYSDEDNQTRPFRIVVLDRGNSSLAEEPSASLAEAMAEPSAMAITITNPREQEVLSGSGETTIRWTTTGDVGNRVKLAILDTRTGEKMLTAETENDGAFNADLFSLPAAEYTLLISAADTAVKARKIRFKIHQSEEAKPIELASPLPGGTWRGTQVLPVKWRKMAPDAASTFYNFTLVEQQTGKRLRINFNPVAAKSGLLNWTVPDDGTVFGYYKLEVTAQNGAVVGTVENLEFLPSFVTDRSVRPDQAKPNHIIVDLGIKNSGFSGPHFNFVIRNNGPYELSAGLTVSFSFKTYFVRHVPIRSKDDLVICNSNLLARMPVNTEQTLWPGRDPNCGAGTRSSNEKFVYAVSRISLPDTIDINFKGDRKANNMAKYYWDDATQDSR
jgi:hypothetical protein